MPRRYDPERRQRLIDAAIRVVRDQGIAGLTHRRVAAEADVPLGSTTYHFASREDLLAATLHQFSEQWLRGLDRWEQELPAGAPLAEAAAGMVEESLADGRDRTRLEYELYLAALRHDTLHPVAAHCVDGLAAILRRRTRDDATARALAALIDGLTLQLVLTGRSMDRAEIRALLEPLAAAGGA